MKSITAPTRALHEVIQPLLDKGEPFWFVNSEIYEKDPGLVERINHLSGGNIEICVVHEDVLTVKVCDQESKDEFYRLFKEAGFVLICNDFEKRAKILELLNKIGMLMGDLSGIVKKTGELDKKILYDGLLH